MYYVSGMSGDFVPYCIGYMYSFGIPCFPSILLWLCGDRKVQGKHSDIVGWLREVSMSLEDIN